MEDELINVKGITLEEKWRKSLLFKAQKNIKYLKEQAKIIADQREKLNKALTENGQRGQRLTHLIVDQLTVIEQLKDMKGN